MAEPARPGAAGDATGAISAPAETVRVARSPRAARGQPADASFPALGSCGGILAALGVILATSATSLGAPGAILQQTWWL